MSKLKNREDMIYHVLRNAIFNTDLPPGIQLIESSLADSFGVSRTPIRTVLQRLKYESLVEIIPKRGAFVYCPSPKEAEQIFFVRQVLEPEAAALASKFVTENQLQEMKGYLQKEEECYKKNMPEKALPVIEKFHMVIIEASGNPYLVESLRKIISLSHIILTFYDVSENHCYDVLKEHTAIYNAIANGEEEEAKRMAYLHIPSIVKDIDFSKQFNTSLSISQIITKYM
ncbi:MAG: GntR family transcriptional regulator [Bacillus sp. (in: firmicutes)]